MVPLLATSSKALHSHISCICVINYMYVHEVRVCIYCKLSLLLSMQSEIDARRENFMKIRENGEVCIFRWSSGTIIWLQKATTATIILSFKISLQLMLFLKISGICTRHCTLHYN